MKKALLLLSILATSSILTLVILYQVTSYKNHKDNGFIRLFPPHPILPENSIDVTVNSYYIAGGNRNQFYFGNHTAPLNVLITNRNLSDTLHAKIKINQLKELRLRKVKLIVDSPFFFLQDGIRPALLKGTLQTMTATKFMYDSTYFTDALPLSPNSFAIRAVNMNRENIIGKEMNTKPYTYFNKGILKKQVDGLFCTDGMLRYNKQLNKIIYTYHYRNEYIMMDTSLNIQYTGKTIDTITQAQIKVALIKSDNTITMAAPATTVNKRSCTWNKFLFIQSGLLATNENKKSFDQASVIDVYDLENRTYKFSFYLFDHGDNKLFDFMVFDGILVALFDHHIMTYSLVPKYFDY